MTSTTQPPIVIGQPDDPHVGAVTSALGARGVKPFVVDLDTIMSRGGESGLVIGESGCLLGVDGVNIDLTVPRNGWVRRFQQADWALGVETGSLRALELGTWHAAYSWALDQANVSWVTDPRDLRLAESKLAQWRAASRLGVPYPRTLLTTSRSAAMSAFSGAVVVKPLATGQYLSDGELKTVYAEAMMPDDERLHALNAVPFIVQERLHARRHLRVVTVGHRSWVAALPVDASAPADWRQNAANHSSFVEVNDEAPGVRRSALAVARDLGLGYTSQDWIEEGDGGTFLVDVNPAGQWLFLPEAIGVAVSEAIADLLLVVP